MKLVTGPRVAILLIATVCLAMPLGNAIAQPVEISQAQVSRVLTTISQGSSEENGLYTVRRGASVEVGSHEQVVEIPLPCYLLVAASLMGLAAVYVRRRELN
ncbi:hypothetical protein QVA66_10435 [Staphylococcus chromogenes]|nr:hypothetical protein [Staphylococcus chromogenes]